MDLYETVKLFVIIFLLVGSLAVKTNAQDFTGTNARERNVLKLINSLPEIMKENQRRKKANVPLLLKACIQGLPTNAQNYYKVSVSEDLGFQLRTYDWYEVDAHSYVIKYDDMITGRTISLAVWRKQLRSRKKGA